ncbi:MAG: NAD(P)/FAD-dependent oxidoreductase [Burkholderiales bacterium]
MAAVSNTNQHVIQWLAQFGAALDRQDIDRAAALFGDECYWRDFVAFTWNIKTAEGREDIKAMLRATLATTSPRDWTLDGAARERDGVTQAWLTFATKTGHGKGHIRLRGDRCWTLFTTLQSLAGFEEKAGPTREMGVHHGVLENRETWLERKVREAKSLGHTEQPYCLIVGGGQGGIALAARLRRLDVPAIVIEKNQRAGDSWRKRYRSLCLHDPVWYDHMPYLPFPDHWPVFSPKDKIGDWLEMYTKVMEINYWSGTECTGAWYDETANEWDVTVNRNGETVRLRPKQLVLATGMSGFPNMPDIPGMASFKGTLCHSSQHAGGIGYAGKRCVVVGSNNSAHDICADLWEHGADVTMIQRSTTLVVRSEMLKELAWGLLYSEEAVAAGITTDIADMTVASMPLKLLPGVHRPIYEEIKRRDAKLYEGLERRGFMLGFGEDGSGIHSTYLRRGAGYYIDVGASQLIIDGHIKLKSRVAVERIDEQSITLSDGTTLRADLIVFATGYGSMNGWAEKLISREVADKVGKCWGIGSDTKNDPGPWEGELRNMWKPTHQSGLWFHGGNLMQARLYSLYLALQLKARMEGIPTPVHGMGPVHHLR